MARETADWINNEERWGKRRREEGVARMKESIWYGTRVHEEMEMEIRQILGDLNRFWCLHL